MNPKKTSPKNPKQTPKQLADAKAWALRAAKKEAKRTPKRRAARKLARKILEKIREKKGPWKGPPPYAPLVANLVFYARWIARGAPHDPEADLPAKIARMREKARQSSADLAIMRDRDRAAREARHTSHTGAFASLTINQKLAYARVERAHAEDRDPLPNDFAIWQKAAPPAIQRRAAIARIDRKTQSGKRLSHADRLVLAQTCVLEDTSFDSHAEALRRGHYNLGDA